MLVGLPTGPSLFLGFKEKIILRTLNLSLGIIENDSIFKVRWCSIKKKNLKRDWIPIAASSK